MNKGEKILFLFLFTLFTLLGGVFFNDEKNQKEEIYSHYDEFTDIEKISSSPGYDIKNETKNKYQAFLNQNIEKDTLFSGKQAHIFVFSSQQNDEGNEKKSLLEDVIYSRIFAKNTPSLNVHLYEKGSDVRGTFQDENIHLFDVNTLSKNEFISVFIHELAHFYDVNYFEKKVFFDLSNTFYDISWKSTKIMRAEMTGNDFVSGYAMTNKYEDFAESFTYFVIHNEDFARKTLDSEILQKKYDFFHKYVFTNNEFIGTDFSSQEVEKYYWDITKIEYSLENLLDYLKK